MHGTFDLEKEEDVTVYFNFCVIIVTYSIFCVSSKVKLKEFHRSNGTLVK